jgi:hypothetical protein
VRIDRIDLEGFGLASRSFRLPAQGVALWAAPNGSGKSALTSALVAAFYGPRPGDPTDDEERSILLRLTLDDGRVLSVAREVASGRLQATDSRGQDVAAELGGADGVALGEHLFGLTRDEFEQVCVLRHDDLRSTPACPRLLALLRGDRRPDPAPEAAPEPEPRPDAPESLPPPPPLPPRTDDDAGAPSPEDFQIFHSAAEEMTFRISGEAPAPPLPVGGSERKLDLDAVDTPPPPLPPRSSDEPGISGVERLRRLRQELAHIDSRQSAKKAELMKHADRVQELRAEADRLAPLNEAEPSDLAELHDLLGGIAAVTASRDELEKQETEYRAELEARGVPAEELRQLGDLFEALPEEDRLFLAAYRQAETVRRGNQALTRSECRLDDSKLREIVVVRDKAARTAIAPMLLSALGLFGSVATYVFRAPALPPMVPLLVGILGAIVGAALLWRARHLREADRERITASQERKKEQLDELEKEERQATSRLADIASGCDQPNGEVLVEAHDRWESLAEERKGLAGLADREDELVRESFRLRERLGRFAVTQSASETTDSSILDPDEVYRDYVRFFDLRDELTASEAVTEELEEQLIALETERAERRDRIEQALEQMGVDPEADLDAAIEMFARSDSGTIPEPEPAEVEPAEPAPETDVPAPWAPTVSARTEAILRRFLPEVRDVEVDARLLPHVRFREAGPQLGMDELTRVLSAGALDQLCLALRLAIMETLTSSREGLPVILDDPFVRADDARHDRALEFLVEDASARNQVLLLTAQEVRVKWFLHQYPDQRDRLCPIAARRPSSAEQPAPDSSSVSQQAC